jgi:hypothetical protein
MHYRRLPSSAGRSQINGLEPEMLTAIDDHSRVRRRRHRIAAAPGPCCVRSILAAIAR